MKLKRQEQVYNKNVRKWGARITATLVSFLSDTAGAQLAVFGQVWLDQILYVEMIEENGKRRERGQKQKKSFKGEKEHRIIIVQFQLCCYALTYH